MKISLQPGFWYILSSAGSAPFLYIVIVENGKRCDARGRHYDRATRDFITDARPYALWLPIALCSARYADVAPHYAVSASPEICINCQNFGNVVTHGDTDNIFATIVFVCCDLSETMPTAS